MSKYKIEGRITKIVEDSIEAENLQEAIKIFSEIYPDIMLDYINGKEIIGFCENSGLPIFYGDNYSEDEDGIMWLNQNL